jgi:hypothetical protein
MGEKSGLSPELQAIESQYARDVRIVEVRPLLRRFGFFAVISVEVLMAIFLIVVVFGYIINGSFVELRAAGVTFGTNIDTFRAIASESDAKALDLGTAKVLQGTPTSYDFYSTISNVNDDWFATFTYSFHAGSVTTEEQDGFVMPGERAYLLALGIKAEGKPSAPTVSVQNIVWHHVDRHVAPDTADWLARHNGFVISEPTYTTDIDFGTEKIGRTTFTITNATPYAYWAPRYTVILERAGAIVGISQATLTEFDSSEVRDVEVRWYGDIPVTATATVIPAMNYFDPDSYMPPRGTPGEDIRDTLQR